MLWVRPHLLGCMCCAAEVRASSHHAHVQQDGETQPTGRGVVVQRHQVRVHQLRSAVHLLSSQLSAVEPLTHLCAPQMGSEDMCDAGDAEALYAELKHFLTASLREEGALTT